MSPQTVVDREDVHAKQWKPIPEFKGVTQKVLWHEGLSYAGLMHLEPGAHVGEHTHHFAAHHVWVVEGVIGVDGRTLGPGSYCHVAAGTEHGIVEVGLEGATIFYLYLREKRTDATPSSN